MMETLKKGSVGFASRRLSASEAKQYERLLKEQKRLTEKASKTMKAYESKTEKIRFLLEQARKGDVSRVESYVKKLQTELDGALSRAELAASETSDLQREMADRRLQERSDQRMQNDERRVFLASELESRGVSFFGHDSRDDQGLESGDRLVPEETAMADFTGQMDDQEEVLASGTVIYPQINGQNLLACDSGQIVARIKELSHEIELNQQWPETTDSESLRLAKQIMDLNSILRQSDKTNEISRDRISIISQ